MAEIALKRGQIGVALENYLAAARETKDPVIAKRATQIAEFAQAGPQTLEAAQIWVQDDPNNLEARQALAVLLMREGKLDASITQLEKMINMAGADQSQMFMRLVAQLVREKNKEAALSLLEKLASRHPDNPHVAFANAHLSARLNKLPRALASINHALELKSDWSDAVILKSRILQLENKTDEAVKFFGKAIKEQFPKDVNLRMAYARMLMDLKQLDEAREQYVILSKQQPDNAEFIYAAGLLSLQSEHYDDAEKYLLSLYKKNEHVTEVSYYLGQVADAKKQYSKAMNWYHKVKQGDLYINAQMRIAAILSKQKRVKEALDQVHSIRASNSQEQLQLYLLEGDIMVDIGNYQKAYDIYDHALADMPDDNNLLYARAIAAEKIDKLDVVENDLRSILVRDPDNIQALNALGYTLADRTKRYDEAFRLIKRAYELDPKDAAIMDSMGWVQYRLGNLDQALKYLKQAMELMDDVEVAAHLGEVLWVKGDKKEAVEVWNKALKVSPKNKMILDVMRHFGL